MKILIIGNGYLGSRCGQEWPDAVVSDVHIESVADAGRILREHQPDAVLNAAGVVGKPNVDWCETHQFETIEGNTVLPILIAQACARQNIYLLHIGTGCVFYGYKNDRYGWTEEDMPNPAVVYTRAKYAADLALTTLPNVGIARIRMPLDNRPSPSNLIDKLIRFSKVMDVINSLTVVPDMITVFRALLERRATGIFHATNPGAISHREILALYEELVDPGHRNQWVEEAELLACGLTNKKRSNTILHSVNLPRLGITMPEVHQAVRTALTQYAVVRRTR